jgi:hypothetical protein
MAFRGIEEEELKDIKGKLPDRRRCIGPRLLLTSKLGGKGLPLQTA